MIRPHPRAGFSLIEALVALAIAALVLAAIFELQVQMVRGQQRAALALEQVMLQENALALTRDINPMERPEGRIDLPDGATVIWTSTPRGAPVRNTGYPSGDGQFDVQLFSVTVQVQRQRGRSPRPMVFDRVGWRRLTEEFE